MNAQASNFDYQDGDTFLDIRDGQTGTVTITNARPDLGCYQLRWSHMKYWEPGPYVTGSRLVQIIGHAEPISRGNVPTDEDLGLEDVDSLIPIKQEDLIPAETLSVTVCLKSDGNVELNYFAWSDVWGHHTEGEPRALLNEVKGRKVFYETGVGIASAAAQLIAEELYPYRLSPETHIAVRLSEEKHSLGIRDRIRFMIFGASAPIDQNDLTRAIKNQMCQVAASD